MLLILLKLIISDVNECQTGLCNDTHNVCVNTVGSYNCTCASGFIMGAYSECIGNWQVFLILYYIDTTVWGIQYEIKD